MLFVSVFYIVRFIVKGENNITSSVSMSEGTTLPSHSIGNSTGFFFSIMFREGDKLVPFTEVEQ
jgi:hypothetical protein